MTAALVLRTLAQFVLALVAVTAGYLAWCEIHREHRRRMAHVREASR